MFQLGRRSRRQLPQLGPQHAAARAGDQAAGAGLAQHRDAPLFHLLAQHCIQHAARIDARGFDPMAARGRFGVLGKGRGGFAARVVEVGAVGRVGGLRRCRMAAEFDAQPLQPGQQFQTAVAEGAQGGLADGIAAFLSQILEHRLRRVLVAGLALVAGAAAEIDHAAALDGGAAAVEPLDDAHIRAFGLGAQGGGAAGGTKAHHQHIALVVPAEAVGLRHRQRAVDGQHAVQRPGI